MSTRTLLATVPICAAVLGCSGTARPSPQNGHQPVIDDVNGPKPPTTVLELCERVTATYRSATYYRDEGIEERVSKFKNGVIIHNTASFRTEFRSPRSLTLDFVSSEPDIKGHVIVRDTMVHGTLSFRTENREWTGTVDRLASVAPLLSDLAMLIPRMLIGTDERSSCRGPEWSGATFGTDDGEEGTSLVRVDSFGSDRGTTLWIDAQGWVIRKSAETKRKTTDDSNRTQTMLEEAAPNTAARYKDLLQPHDTIITIRYRPSLTETTTNR
jgi:hypothetical protein